MAVYDGYEQGFAGYYRKADGSGPYAISAAGVATLLGQAAQPLPAGTDRSGAIVTGNSAQVLVAANPARQSLKGQNISAGDLWINEIGGTAAVDAAGSYRVPAGATFSVNTSRAVSIIGATTGQKFTATES